MRRREIAWLKQYERAEPLDGLTGADPNRGCFE